MKKSRFRTDQIIGIAKEHEAGMKAPDLARKQGGSEHTIYRWRAMCGGMSVSDAARLKALEDENRRLKHPLAGQVLDNQSRKVALGKNY